MVFGRDYSRRVCRSQEKPGLESMTIWAKGGIYEAGEKGLGKLMKIERKRNKGRESDDWCRSNIGC